MPKGPKFKKLRSEIPEVKPLRMLSFAGVIMFPKDRKAAMTAPGDGDSAVDTAEFTEVALTELALTELSPTEWRVAKASAAENDPTGLLGFIQRIGSAYEVTDLGHVRERSYYSSFCRAIASLSPAALHHFIP